MQKLRNKQSTKVICRFDDLEQHTARVRKPYEQLKNLSATHAFDYMMFRIN